jgi:acyl dehydratase
MKEEGREMDIAEIGYAIPTGTVDQAREMVGIETSPRCGMVTVNDGMILSFCAMVEDPNPAYWVPDDQGRRYAPPAMFMTWVMSPPWMPGGAKPEPLLAAKVPLPGTSLINAFNDTIFFDWAKTGDRVCVTERLVQVSDEKATALGKGHVVTTRSLFTRKDSGEKLAQMDNVLFRFTPWGNDPEIASSSNKAQDQREDVREMGQGERIGPISDTITYRRAIMNSPVTWDYFPGHYDPRYARAQGMPEIYLNSMHLMGFVDRVVLGWAGEGSFLTKRSFRALAPVLAGDTITAYGEVVSRDASQSVEVSVSVVNQTGLPCCRATVVLVLGN